MIKKLLIVCMLFVQFANAQVISTQKIQIAMARASTILEAIQIAKDDAEWLYGTLYFFENDDKLVTVKTAQGEFGIFLDTENTQISIFQDDKYKGMLIESRIFDDGNILLIFDTPEAYYAVYLNKF